VPSPRFTHRFRANILRGAILLSGCAALGALGGCYERVVGAHGFGADQYSVSQPYQESGRIDDWVFGKTSKRTNKTLLPQD
jgi:hypothetical protein